MENRIKYKIIISDRARQMLAGHIHFLAKKSPNAARNTKKQFNKGYKITAANARTFSIFER
jgi:plasmid stabilization system protein ParE